MRRGDVPSGSGPGVVLYSILLCVLFAGHVSGQEDYTTWSDVQRIVVNTSASGMGANVTETVTAIPILVRLHPGNFSGFDRTQPKGADIRFAKADGTPLPYQIERWADGANNNDTAEIWVRLDTVFALDSTHYFQMYFGNAGTVDSGNGAAVFDSAGGFVGVWHLAETPDTASAALLNSSQNAHHGRPRGGLGSASSVAGVVGKAVQFNGSSDFVSFGDINAIDGVSRLTVAIWFKATQLRDWANLINKSESNANGWYIIQNGGGYNGSDDFLVAVRNQGNSAAQDGATSTDIIPTGAWSQCVMVYDGTQSNDTTRLRFYFNGVKVPLVYRPAIPSIIPATAAHVQIGKSYFENTFFYGALDEPVIIRDTRSASWIKLYYQTQKPGANCVILQKGSLPSIVAQQPTADTTIIEGSPLAFRVTVSSATTARYAWYKNGASLGRTTAGFTIAGTRVSDSGSYRCTVTNDFGSVQSRAVKVTVIPAGTAPVITVQPKDTAVVATTQAWLRVAATGTAPFTYAWYKITAGQGVAVAGQTTAHLSFARAAFADSGYYYCIIGNDFGAAVSDTVKLTVQDGRPFITAGGQPRDTIVLENNPWSMTVTATGEGSLAYGWFKGSVVPADTVPGQRARTIRYQSARLSDSGVYYCVVSNAFGACTSRAAMLRVAPNNRQVTNPITIQTAFVDTTHIQLKISRYDELPLTPADRYFPWAADTVLVWYRVGSFPTAVNRNDPNLIRFPLAQLLASQANVFDSIITVSAIGCLDYFFKGSVHWNNSSTGRDSIPPFANNDAAGDAVRMCDTTRLMNPLRFFFAVPLPSDSTVTVTLSGLTVSFRQLHLIKSLDLRYSVGGSSFSDTVIPKAALGTVGDSISISVRDVRFAEDETWSQWEVFYTGINDNPCDTVRDSCRVGTPRPENTAVLRVDMVLATQANLSWTATGGPYSLYRLWYSEYSIPDSISRASSMYYADTFPGSAASGVIRGLAPNKTYYCGLQVQLHGKWSLITTAARCTLTTDTIGDDLPIANKVVLDTIEYDSGAYRLRLIWHVDTAEILLNAGIRWVSFPGDSFPLPDIRTTKYNTRQSGAPDTFHVTIDGVALEFGKSYTFGVWLQKDQGVWSYPTDASIQEFTIPQPSAVPVQIFDETGIIIAFGGAVVLREIDNVETTGYLRRVDLNMQGSGLLPVSMAVSIEPSRESRIRFLLGLRYDPALIPLGYSVDDVRMYRYDTTRSIWLYDTATVVKVAGDASILSIQTYLSSCTYPFVLAIDEQVPDIVVSGDTTSPVSPGEQITVRFTVNDNMANPLVLLHAGEGDNIAVINDTIERAEAISGIGRDWTISGNVVEGESGIRAIITVHDGRFITQANVSRDILFSYSDVTRPKQEQWTPLGATAVLDEPGIRQALDEYGTLEKTWKYDIYTLRLFRFLQKDWQEYSETVVDSFTLVPGRVIWLKTRKDTAIDFGSGRSVSLKSPQVIRLPGKSWTDFCLPYRFDMRIGDVLTVIDSSAASVLQFYRWKKSGGERPLYSAEEFYLPQIQAVNDRTRVIRYVDENSNKEAFTVWNPLDSDVELRIPPVPLPLSNIRYEKKAARSNGWCVVVRPSVPQGDLSPVLCAYDDRRSGYFDSPLPPNLYPVSVGIMYGHPMRVCGTLVTGELRDGGFACDLVFSNSSADKTRVSCRIEQIAGADVAVAVIDPSRGIRNNNGQMAELDLDACSKTYRTLVIGTPEFINDYRSINAHPMFGVHRIAPNPFKTSVRIEYHVPFEGVEEVRCEIIDQLGRLVWSTARGDFMHPGKNRFIWTPLHSQKELASGAYFVRLIGFDGKGKKAGEGISKVLYLP
ncbi:MAG: DUF2341 domain-containing protein [Chitinispirillaceae bacterium]|nr:DUF2341 domain-containing protein [Chitinispirillaceae bacterium]